MRWSNKYKVCRECETTNNPHEARGLCKPCYKKFHYWNREKINRFYTFLKEKKRLYMKAQKGKLVNIRYKDSLIPTPFTTNQDVTEDEMMALNAYLKVGYGRVKRIPL